MSARRECRSNVQKGEKIKKKGKRGKKRGKGKHATQRAVFDRCGARHSSHPFHSFAPLFFFNRRTSPRRAAPETPAVGGETFFHGHGCAPTCGMRHGSPVESFLMTGKTTDRTWTRPQSRRRDASISHISDFILSPALMVDQVVTDRDLFNRYTRLNFSRSSFRSVIRLYGTCTVRIVH